MYQIHEGHQLCWYWTLLYCSECPSMYRRAECCAGVGHLKRHIMLAGFREISFCAVCSNVTITCRATVKTLRKEHGCSNCNHWPLPLNSSLSTADIDEFEPVARAGVSLVFLSVISITRLCAICLFVCYPYLPLKIHYQWFFSCVNNEIYIRSGSIYLLNYIELNIRCVKLQSSKHNDHVNNYVRR